MLALITALVLTACGGNEETTPTDDANTGTENANEEGTESKENMDEENSNSIEEMNHAGMDHSSSVKFQKDWRRLKILHIQLVVKQR